MQRKARQSELVRLRFVWSSMFILLAKKGKCINGLPTACHHVTFPFLLDKKKHIKKNNL